MNGKHIELFLVNGVSGGMTTTEIAGWTGHVLAGPRSEIGAILQRDEAKRNGTYLLLGTDDDVVGGVRAYVGRTEDFIKRFNDHKANKDLWDRVVIITSKDDAFNEGHWGYLEARLVELAKQASRCALENTQSPIRRRLSEAQASDMEAFLSQLQIVLPVLGVGIFRLRPSVRIEEVQPIVESPVFRMTIAKSGVNARAQADAGEFVVLAGSRVVRSWDALGKAASTQRAYATYRRLHEKLVADGSIKVEGRSGILTRDVPFTSPSTAGAVVSGHSCNGRTQWIYDGGTYGSWEDRGVNG